MIHSNNNPIIAQDETLSRNLRTLGKNAAKGSLSHFRVVKDYSQDKNTLQFVIKTNNIFRRIFHAIFQSKSNSEALKM